MPPKVPQIALDPEMSGKIQVGPKRLQRLHFGFLHLILGFESQYRFGSRRSHLQSISKEGGIIILFQSPFCDAITFSSDSVSISCRYATPQL